MPIARYLFLSFVSIIFVFSTLSAPAALATSEGTLVVAMSATQTILDPTIQSGALILNPASHIFDFLVWRDEKLQFRPMLALSWTFPNPTTLRMRLRQGVVFHNGDPLSADDVVFTIKRILDPRMQSRLRPFLNQVSDVRAVDRFAVDLILRNPDSTLFSRLAVVGILPKKYIESVGEERWQAAPIGTGPFRVRQWLKGQRLVLEAFDGYWGTKPLLKTLVYRSIADDRTRMAGVRAGEIDVAVNVPPAEAASLRTDPNISLVTTPSLRTLFLVLNTEKPPLNDVRVRKALAHALDKQLIIGTVLEGYAQSVKLPWGPQSTGYNPDVIGYGYDPERARNLLREAGFPSGFPLTMVVPSGRYLAGNESAQAIAGQWEKVGVRASLRFFEFEFWLRSFVRQFSRDMDVNMVGNANSTADPYHNLNSNFNPSDQGLYWSNSELEDLTARAAQELGPRARQALYYRAGEIIAADLPVIPLWQFIDVYAVRKRVQGFSARPDELMNFRQVSVK